MLDERGSFVTATFTPLLAIVTVAPLKLAFGNEIDQRG